MEDYSELEKNAIKILREITSEYVDGRVETLYTPHNPGYSLKIKLTSHIGGVEGEVLFYDGKLSEITNVHDEKFKERFLEKYNVPSQAS